MKRITLVVALIVAAACFAVADVDWQKVCAKELGIDLTAPREDWQPPALAILATAVGKDLAGIAAFTEGNIHFFIAKPGGKILFQSEPTEVYAFSPEDIKTEINTVDLNGRPGFAVRYESFSGGSGMAENDVHWELFGRGEEDNYASLLTLDGYTEMVYSRWYGGDNITAWQWGGTNGERFTPQFIAQKGQYPLVLLRYERFNAEDFNSPEQGKEELTDIWYQAYSYDSDTGEYSQLVDPASPDWKYVIPGIYDLARARIIEDAGDYAGALVIYEQLTNWDDPEVKKAANLAVADLTTSKEFNFEDRKLYKAQDYETLIAKYPTSKLTARAIMTGNEQSTEDLLGVMRDFPDLVDAENAAFVILYNGIGTAKLEDRANMDKAMDFLKTHVTEPAHLAYYYGLYGDCLLGAAIDDTMDEKAVGDALAAYDTGYKADPDGIFAGYLRCARARGLAESGDEKDAMREMLSFLREMPDDWWSGEGWMWLGERVAGAEEGSISLDGGTVAEIGAGQTVALATHYSSDNEPNYWISGYLLKGTELREQLRLPGYITAAWNADVTAKGSHDLFIYTSPKSDHLVLYQAKGGKFIQLLDADLGTYGKKPDVVVETGGYPAALTVRQESGDLHFIFNPTTGVYEAK
jgi:hypothetical protein